MNASEAGGNVPCFDTNLSSFLFRCKLASITRATYYTTKTSKSLSNQLRCHSKTRSLSRLDRYSLISRIESLQDERKHGCKYSLVANTLFLKMFSRLHLNATFVASLFIQCCINSGLKVKICHFISSNSQPRSTE